MTQQDLQLLQKLCSVHAPSGSEKAMRDLLIDHVNTVSPQWKVQPQLIYGDEFQDCLIILFGKPRTAIYAHMDSVGYTVGYNNDLIKIGGPKAEEGTVLLGSDSNGLVKGKLHYEIEEEEEEKRIVNTRLIADREIERGTTLTYEVNFSVKDDYVESCYLDNRLGIWNALKVAETLENGALVFSCWEEVGGGSVGYLGKYLWEQWKIRQALISDITWVTNGVKHGKGVAVSMRDSGIPRRSYIERIIELSNKSGLPYQLEVESAGGSDGNALQRSPYPIDWCFIGAPEDNVHMPNERVHLDDIKSMHLLYTYLMKNL
jgi:putative aminopeptidase FrvX